MPKKNIWNYITEEEMLNDYEYFIGLLKEEIEQLKEENKRLRDMETRVINRAKGFSK